MLLKVMVVVQPFDPSWQGDPPAFIEVIVIPMAPALVRDDLRLEMASEVLLLSRVVGRVI